MGKVGKNKMDKKIKIKIRINAFAFLLFIILVIFLISLYRKIDEKQNNKNFYIDKEKLETVEIEPVEMVSINNFVCYKEEKDKNIVVKGEEKASFVKISEEERELLLSLIMAEAEGEDLEGKKLVACTVLNRVKSEEFPDNIVDVIYQKKQFSPISDGRINSVIPNSDCEMALDAVLSGEDKSKGCLYFAERNAAKNWHDKNLDFLFEYGNHKFYK